MDFLLDGDTQARLTWRLKHSGKECATCRVTLPLSAFGPRPSSPDGLKSVCRPCAARAERDRRAKDNS